MNGKAIKQNKQNKQTCMELSLSTGRALTAFLSIISLGPPNTSQMGTINTPVLHMRKLGSERLFTF